MVYVVFTIGAQDTLVMAFVGNHWGISMALPHIRIGWAVNWRYVGVMLRAKSDSLRQLTKRSRGLRRLVDIGRLSGLALVLLLPVMAATDHVQADPGLTLHLVTGPDYKPFSDPSLPQGGMHGEIVRAAFAKIGDQVDITFEPWARGYADTQRLAFDATFPYVRTADREKDFLYSDVIYVIFGRVFVLADSSLIAKTPADLAGSALCLPNGYVLPDKIQTLVDSKSIRLERSTGMEQCFKMLQMHRVDFVICSDIQARATALRLWGKDDGVRSLFVVAESTHSLIVPRQNPNAARILADFNDGLAKLKASGELDAIIERQLKSYFVQISN